VPEGDTIFRTATTLRRWIAGREVTSAVGPAGIDRAVGATVTAVEPKGKHLLIRFSSGILLHTHMRMTGSWHVYPAGERWQRPRSQARVVLTCGDRVAVCFNAPVVQVLADHEERIHPALVQLGPDVLTADFDLDEVLTRAAARPPRTLVGELLLDQTVVAGFGNIYRCEALFLRGIDPWTPIGELTRGQIAELVEVGRRIIGQNAGPGSPIARDFGAGRDGVWVYGRTGRPCRRCGTSIRSDRLGEQARMAHWCPRCQVRGGRPGDPVAAEPHQSHQSDPGAGGDAPTG
jgi:endonuclease-8